MEKLLAAKGVAVEVRDDMGRTPLYLAARGGHWDVVQQLLEVKGVDANARDEKGWTPLTAAIHNMQQDVVDVLLENRNVDPDCRTHMSQTPLMIAAQMPNIRAMEALLKTGQVDRNATCLHGHPVWWYALQDYMDPTIAWEDKEDRILRDFKRQAAVELLLEDGFNFTIHCDDVEEWARLSQAVGSIVTHLYAHLGGWLLT